MFTHRIMISSREHILCLFWLIWTSTSQAQFPWNDHEEDMQQFYHAADTMKHRRYTEPRMTIGVIRRPLTLDPEPPPQKPPQNQVAISAASGTYKTDNLASFQTYSNLRQPKNSVTQSPSDRRGNSVNPDQGNRRGPVAFRNPSDPQVAHFNGLVSGNHMMEPAHSPHGSFNNQVDISDQEQPALVVEFSSRMETDDIPPWLASREDPEFAEPERYQTFSRPERPNKKSYAFQRLKERSLHGLVHLGQQLTDENLQFSVGPSWARFPPRIPIRPPPELPDKKRMMSNRNQQNNYVENPKNSKSSQVFPDFKTQLGPADQEILNALKPKYLQRQRLETLMTAGKDDEKRGLSVTSPAPKIEKIEKNSWSNARIERPRTAPRVNPTPQAVQFEPGYGPVKALRLSIFEAAKLAGRPAAT